APWPRKPPNRIRLSSKIPAAWKNVIVRKLKSDGRIPFHRSITIRLPSAKATTASTANFTTTAMCLGPPWTSCKLFIILLGLSFCEVLVNGLQPPAQVLHGIALAGKQSVHADSFFFGEFPEAASAKFMRNEDFALFFG